MRILNFIAAGVCILFSACNKQLHVSDVPRPVMETYYRDFPQDVDVTWEEKNNGLIEANVNLYGELVEVLYCPDGSVVEMDN